jgi:YggT family protein
VIAIVDTVISALGIYRFVLLGHVIFSWVPRPPEPLIPVRLGLAALVEPLLRPLRGKIPPLRLGGVALDLSIIVLFIGLIVLQGVLGSIRSGLV